MCVCVCVCACVCAICDVFIAHVHVYLYKTWMTIHVIAWVKSFSVADFFIIVVA